jgi:enoyl-CoA hydratase
VEIGGTVTFSHIEIERRHHTGLIWLNRPEKRNALSPDMWADLPAAAGALSEDADVRAIVVAGRGPAFTVGIDLQMLGTLAPEGDSEAARRMAMYRRIRELQTSFTSLADSPKPVIAAIHGYCLGAGIDLITACDIRLASSDARFGVRETVMGLVADVGTLQRLPAIVGPGQVAEMVYSGRDIDAERALRIGLVNDVYPDADSTLSAATELADTIAANSPLVVQGAKKVLRAGEGRTVAEGLDYVAVWNAAFLLSDDLTEAMTAFVEKRKPEYKGQ